MHKFTKLQLWMRFCKMASVLDQIFRFLWQSSKSYNECTKYQSVYTFYIMQWWKLHKPQDMLNAEMILWKFGYGTDNVVYDYTHRELIECSSLRMR